MKQEDHMRLDNCYANGCPWFIPASISQSLTSSLFFLQSIPILFHYLFIFPQSYSDYGVGGASYGSYSQDADLSSSLSSTAAANDSRPRILLMGVRRSGKSSIQKVVFHKMSPHETLFLESTNDIRLRDIHTSALVQFQLLDFPGHYDFSDSRKSGITPERVFQKLGALVFVIDAQDDENQFSESIDYFIQMAKLAYKINPKMSFDVLIHKVDGDAYLSDDHKIECQNEIKKSISEELLESGLPIRPSFHLTSIYDHTIFEAFSKIVQSLIPQLPLLEKLLNGLISSCSMEKSFLFDVVSKIYVATDSNPVDMQTYELVSDMIDVVIDVSCIYGLKSNGEGESSDDPSAVDGDKSSEQFGVDSDSSSVIKLSNNYILYLREVNKCLALVCLLRAESYQVSGLIEYNFSCFKKAIADLLEAKAKFKQTNEDKKKQTNQPQITGTAQSTTTSTQQQPQYGK